MSKIPILMTLLLVDVSLLSLSGIVHSIDFSHIRCGLMCSVSRFLAFHKSPSVWLLG